VFRWGTGTAKVGGLSSLFLMLTSRIEMAASNPKATIQNLRAVGLMTVFGRKQPSVNR
jgi:hypothetical protein